MFPVIAVYVAVVLIWSTTPLAIRFSVDSVDFVQGSALRMWISLALCLLLLPLFKLKLTFDKASLQRYAASALGICFAMLCVYWSAQTLPSGLIAVLWGLTPILVSLQSRCLIYGTRLDAIRLISMVLAVIGLYVIFAQQIALAPSMALALAVLLVAVNFHSLSAVLLQKLQLTQKSSRAEPMHPLVQTTGGLLVSAPIYALVWLLMSGPLPEVMSWTSIGAIAYLSIVGSAAGFIGYFYLLSKMSAADASLITLMTPVIALFLGTTLANETLSERTLIGASIILCALFIYHLKNIQLVLVRLAQKDRANF